MYALARLGLILCAVGLLATFGSCGGDHDDGPPVTPGGYLPDDYELNNTLGDCRLITLDFLVPDLNLHNEYDEDYFCFDLTSDSFVVVTVDFIHASGNIDIQLLDAASTSVIAFSSSQQNIELMNELLSPGSYAVRVYSPSGDTNVYGIDIMAVTNGGSCPSDALEPLGNDTFCGPDIQDIVASPYFMTSLSIHDPADLDYFCFDIADLTTVDIKVSFFHSFGNIDMELLDSSQGVMAGSYSQNDNETLSVVLRAGQYSILVFGAFDPGVTDNCYSIDVSGALGGGLPPDPDDLPPGDNDTPGACSALGDLNLTPEYRATDLTIHTSDDEDYYCFTLSQDSNVTVDITFVNTLGNLDLELLDASAGLLGFSYGPTDNERVMADLLAGDYIVHVFGISNAINTYNLSINVFGPDGYETPPNDDYSNCSQVTLTSAPPTLFFSDTDLTIHNPFDEDWFCFTLPSQGTDWDVTVDVLFEHAVGDLDIDLVDSQGTLIQWSDSNDDNEQILSTLSPGDYGIRVFGFVSIAGFGGALNRYDLNILAAPALGGLPSDPVPWEPNNSFSSCSNVGNLDWAGAGFTIHNSGDSDYYCFTMTGAGDHTVTVDLTFLHANGDLDMELYMGPPGQPTLIAMAEGNTDNEQLVVVVPATLTYAVRVFGYNGATNTYDISISDTNTGSGFQMDGWEVNDDFAWPIPNWQDEGQFTNNPNLSIHNSVDQDYIGFQVAQPSSVTVNLTFTVPSVAFDLDMAILDDNRNFIAWAQSGSNNETLQVNVAPGIAYRIWVYGFQGGMNDYGFTITSGAPVPPGMDAYEPNDSLLQRRVVQVPAAIPNLSIHDPLTDDYYEVKFQNPDVLTVTLSFTHALGNIDLELLDISGALIADSVSTTNREEIVENLMAGDYVIHVFSPVANNYRMDLSSAAGGGGLIRDDYEFNDDQASCEVIALPFAEPNLTIHNPFDEDYFCFDLPRTSRVTVELRFLHVLGDIDVSLWCVWGGRQEPQSPECPGFVGGSSSFTDNEIIDDGQGGGLTLKEGSYYIIVESAFGGTNNYEMNVTAN